MNQWFQKKVEGCFWRCYAFFSWFIKFLRSVNSYDKQDQGHQHGIICIMWYTILKNTIMVLNPPRKKAISRFFTIIDPLFRVNNFFIFSPCKSSAFKHPIEILSTCEIPESAIKSNPPQSLFQEYPWEDKNIRDKSVSLKRDLGFSLRNITHILDMSFCHKHQQQRYHNKNTKICVLIHYMYVDMFFPKMKAIPVMFERVATHYQTPQTWIDHNETPYHNLNTLPHALPHKLPHGLPCIFSQFNVETA